MSQDSLSHFEKGDSGDSKKYLKLMPYDQATSLIRNHFNTYVAKVESVRADASLGRVSAQDVRSLVDIPSTSISGMDGYALKHIDIASVSSTNPATLKVRGSIFSDHSKKRIPNIKNGETYYVATGAPLPEGSDTVVRVEQAVEVVPDSVMFKIRSEVGKNVAQKGEDVKKGEIMIRRGQVISPADVALLIGIGRTRVKVTKAPVVGILSTGNELREFDPSVRFESGHVVNNYQMLLAGYVAHFGAKFVSLGVCKDDTNTIQKRVTSALKKCDCVLTISGSSVGRRDNAIGALKSIKGSKHLFHGLRVVPIRPAGVLIIGSKPVIIVPGHATSALLTFFTIVLPILNELSGLAFSSRLVKLRTISKGRFVNERALDAILLAKLDHNNEQYCAIPMNWGSNLLSTLAQSDGFVWLGPHQAISEGKEVTVQLFSISPLAKSSWSLPRK